MRPRPKFCVGEEVTIRCYSQPDIPKTEIIELVWVNNKELGIPNGKPYRGWGYRVPNQQDKNAVASEPQVSKLPPEERQSWDDSIFNPLKQGIEV